MKQRLPLILSVTALVVSLLGATPFGQAARSAIAAVPFANVAGFAKNAGKLNGHRSSTKPTAGQIPVVGSNGKLPASIGAVGRQGATGAAGPQGPPGLSAYQLVQQQVNAPSGEGGQRLYSVPCPGGKSVLGGGFDFNSRDLTVNRSNPSDSGSAWEIRLRNTTGNTPNVTTTVYAVCANVSS